MPPKRRRRFQGLYYHSSPPKVLPMNGQIANSDGRRRRDPDDLSVKLSTIRIWMHEKDIGKLTRVLWTGQGNRLRQQASTNAKVKRFLAAVPYVMNSIKDVHQAVIDNSLETLQANLEPPVPPALVTCRDANGLNLIHKAAGLGHATILEYLITTWPDGVHETDITGKTPLHWAASAKNNMRCYTLLAQAGCDEEAVDYKMKTPSFYRHKPHEIERAFLTYIPEAPRVSPDVATDWEALSDDSGDGKKLDIKIPEMNGFGRHSIAESNEEENASEAEMTEAVSGHDDEDDEAANEDQHEEKAIEDEAQIKDIEKTEEEQPERENEEIKEPEIEITDGKEDNDGQKEGDEEEEEKEEQQQEPPDEPVEDEETHDKTEETEAPQDEKQQTQSHTETTANLIKDSDDVDRAENENNDSKEQVTDNEDEKEKSDTSDHDNSEENHVSEKENAEHDIDASDDKNSEKEKVDLEKTASELDTDALEEKLSEKENAVIDSDALERKLSAKEKAVIDTAALEEELSEKDKQESNIVTLDGKIVAQEIDKNLKDPDVNNASAEKSTKALDESSNEETSAATKENGKEIDNENKINGGEETEEKNKIDNEFKTDQNEDEKLDEIKNEEKKNNDENENQGDKKTIGDTLMDIKDEVKDNVKHLANQVKNVFSDKDKEHEGIDAEIEDKLENKENETDIDSKEEDKTQVKKEFEDDGYEKENTNESIKEENKETDNPNEINGKANENVEKIEKENASKSESPTENENLKENTNKPETPTADDISQFPETEIDKENSQKQATSASSSDIKNIDSNSSYEKPQTPKASTISTQNSNSINENMAPSLAPKTPSPKETPKKENDKTEEDENNNRNKLAVTAIETGANGSKDLTETNASEAITDEQFKELDKSLEEYKNAEENVMEEKSKDIGEKLEEIADNLKENVKGIADKVANVFSTTDNSEQLNDDDSHDRVGNAKSPRKKVSTKKLFKVGESSDEDEEPQSEAENEKISHEIEGEMVNENKTEPEPETELEIEAEFNPTSDTDPQTNNQDASKKNDEKINNNDGQDGEGSPSSSLAIEGFVQGDAEDNTVQSETAAYVNDDEESRLESIIASGDMEQLAQIVLNGDGQKLLNVEAKEPEIQAFLKNVPNYMDKIRRVHEAARNGSLLNLQQALDRRKFAIAKDEISPAGATPLHVAILFGNSDILRYLSARFPETMTITDNDGRTALHYAAVINDNGHFYNVLLQLGANPKAVDQMGHTPQDYLDREEFNDTLSYGQLLKRFGAEDLEEQLLNDQGRIENHKSIEENPLFKTEQGKYLADNLADPLIKALTQVAQKRPTDPLQYLTNYLQSYAASRNQNGRTITQVAVHSGSSHHTNTTSSASAAHSATPTITQMQRETVRMNGHVQYDNADNIEEDSSMQQMEGFDNDEGNDSDAAMSKNLEERDEHGQSMLHFACARSHRKGGLIHLIEDSKADITYRDELYRTARDVALQANQLGNAKEIDRYVMSLAIVGDIKPIEHFASSGYDHIIDVLDDNDTPIIQVVEGRGLNDLSAYLKTIRPLEELREEMHQMIREGNAGRVMEIADGPNGKWLIKAKNYYGRTALHIAILKESVEIVEHFLKVCPEALKVGDNLERTPLHYAMGTSIIESISRALIQNGAKRTYKDLKGRQPSYYFMNKADILRLQEEEDESR